MVQWAKAQDERGHKAPIVVLSSVPKEQLDALVDEARAETGLDIMGRSGVPYSLDDLDLVNARHARTILIMDPKHHEEAEARRPPCDGCSDGARVCAVSAIALPLSSGRAVVGL